MQLVAIDCQNKREQCRRVDCKADYRELQAERLQLRENLTGKKQIFHIGQEVFFGFLQDFFYFRDCLECIGVTDKLNSKSCCLASVFFVSDVTDKILPQIHEWQARPLDEVYPVVFTDATPSSPPNLLQKKIDYAFAQLGFDLRLVIYYFREVFALLTYRLVFFYRNFSALSDFLFTLLTIIQSKQQRRW